MRNRSILLARIEIWSAAMAALPHETLPPSKKRHVWRICDRHWFHERRKPTRGEVRSAYGLTESSLASVDSYLSAWWSFMQERGLAHG